MIERPSIRGQQAPSMPDLSSLNVLQSARPANLQFSSPYVFEWNEPVLAIKDQLNFMGAIMN